MKIELDLDKLPISVLEKLEDALIESSRDNLYAHLETCRWREENCDCDVSPHYQYCDRFAYKNLPCDCRYELFKEISEELIDKVKEYRNGN